MKYIQITIAIDVKLHKSQFQISHKLGPFINAMGKMFMQLHTHSTCEDSIVLHMTNRTVDM